MTLVGITGHINLSPATRPLVAQRIAHELRSGGESLSGMSSLAGGADQIFAEQVIAAGGSLIFVQPCERIEDSFSVADLGGYDRLRVLASETIAMPHVEPSEKAFEAAGIYIADRCDVLLAVWDGRPAGGRGGTADIVAHREASGRPLVVIWPDGAARG